MCIRDSSNPATIMTDKDIADKVYIEPLTTEVVEQLIMKEKPDSVLPTLGGQAGLNLAMELEEAGILAKNNVRLIGTTPLTIKKAEDREMFKETMEKINEPAVSYTHLCQSKKCRTIFLPGSLNAAGRKSAACYCKGNGRNE